MPRAFGQVTTAATTEVAINATTYTEQTSGAQRALVSGSANDAAAGTGARTVKITYFTYNATTGAIAGPFTETVTLNGTSAVATVATNIAFVEKMEVMTAGSGGVAAGTISLKAASDGTGATIASIATGAVQTLLAHHYVASNKQCLVSGLDAVGGDSAAALVQLKALPYPSGVENGITEKIGVTNTLSREIVLPPSQVIVKGPARIRTTVTPANTNSQVTYVGFGFVDRVVVLT